MKVHPTLGVVTRLSRSASFLERVLVGMQKQTGVKLTWSIVCQNPLSAKHKVILARAESIGIQIIVTKAKAGIPLGELANIGVRVLTTEYILLHDDDDALISDFTGPAMLRLAQQNCVAAVCQSAFIHEAGPRKRLDFILSPGKTYVAQRDLLMDNVITVNSLIYRRTAFDAIGGYAQDVEVAEDWLFNIELIKSGRIAIIPLVCAVVYIRRDEANPLRADHTDRARHQEMSNFIRSRETQVSGPDLHNRLNTLPQKIRRQIDRAVFRVSGKLLKK